MFPLHNEFAHKPEDVFMQDLRGSQFAVEDIRINIASVPHAVASIVTALRDGGSFCVNTLNLDHVVKLRTDAKFRDAYRRARFVTADGFPIVVMARSAGIPIARTTGADLVEPLCAEAARGRLPIFLFGATASALATSAQRLRERHPGLAIADQLAPSRDFDPESPEADAAIDRLRRSGARLCLIALGAPKQEIFAARCLGRIDGVGLISIGASLDFIAGTQTRAPKLAQSTGLEWLWRLARSPGRLGPRYARCLAVVPPLVASTLPQIVAARIGRAA